MSGQDFTRIVELVPLESLPMNVPTTFSPQCQVVLDGSSLGTLGELNWSFSVPNLTIDHRVILDCGEADGVHTQVLSNLLLGSPELTFSPQP